MKRGAKTLLETIAAIIVITMMFAACAAMLIALLKCEGRSRRHLEFVTILNRLDDQFRIDVHTAASAKLNETSDVLDFPQPKPSKAIVRYRCRLGEVFREEIDGENALRRESFPLPEGIKCFFEEKAEGMATMLILHTETKPQPGTKIHYPVSDVEAVLARDLRFER
jgi:hypothetical protein